MTPLLPDEELSSMLESYLGHTQQPRPSGHYHHSSPGQNSVDSGFGGGGQMSPDPSITTTSHQYHNNPMYASSHQQQQQPLFPNTHDGDDSGVYPHVTSTGGVLPWTHPHHHADPPQYPSDAKRPSATEMNGIIQCSPHQQLQQQHQTDQDLSMIVDQLFDSMNAQFDDDEDEGWSQDKGIDTKAKPSLRDTTEGDQGFLDFASAEKDGAILCHECATLTLAGRQTCAKCGSDLLNVVVANPNEESSFTETNRSDTADNKFYLSGLPLQNCSFHCTNASYNVVQFWYFLGQNLPLNM